MTSRIKKKIFKSLDSNWVHAHWEIHVFLKLTVCINTQCHPEKTHHSVFLIMIRVVIVLLVVCVVKALSVPLFERSVNLGKPLQINVEEVRHIKAGLLNVETRHLAETNQQAYRSRQNSLFQKYLHSTATDPPDPICNTYSSTHMPYTGFRFVAESKLSTGPAATYLRTRLLLPRPRGHSHLQTLRFGQREILWGSRYCFSPKKRSTACSAAARHRRLLRPRPHSLCL